MITLTRRQARRLRGVLRCSTLGIGHRGPAPPLVLRADGTQLRAQYRYNTLAIEHVEPGSYRPVEAIALPLDALADLEGRDESPVSLETVGPGRTLARWEDRRVPQAREYTVPALDTLADFPEPPGSWSDASPELLDALAEACATADEDNARYALGCIALKGSGGEVVATDGRQLLVQGGFAFPWSGDVLIRRSPLFACKDLPRDRPLALGRTDTHVVLRVGPWTLYLEVQAAARFPDVGRALPAPSTQATRLALDPEDARFLRPALDRLPGADELNSPVTVDCNGPVAIRARGADQAQATELVLARSRHDGPPVRFNVNRAFLARALRLGLAELRVVDADSPVVFRDGRRTYCVQPLSKESALAPTADAIRIVSDAHATATAERPADAPTRASAAANGRVTPAEVNGAASGHTAVNGTTDGHAAPVADGATGLAALIREAEALHTMLGEARARAGRLAVALRQHRRRERLLASTLASIRQLKLQDVAR